MSRIRHCIECPGCRIRYVISLSPYKNGAYLTTLLNGYGEEYILYCRCGRGPSRWSGTEVMMCEVSKAAFQRGFGMANEVLPLNRVPEEWGLDPSQYIKDWRPGEKEKNSDRDLNARRD